MQLRKRVCKAVTLLQRSVSYKSAWALLTLSEQDHPRMSSGAA